VACLTSHWKRSLPAKSRRALLAGVAFFIVAQLGAFLVIDFDPEYTDRLVRLRARLHEKPGRPVVVVLGSSRVAMGIRPEFVPPGPDGRDPVVFNYGLVGSGPVMQLCCLRRLLADGIRPDLVLVEYWPAFWQQEGELREEQRIDTNRLRRTDLALMRRHLAGVRHWRTLWYEGRLVPWFSGRFIFLSRHAPGWVPAGGRLDSSWAQLSPYGYLPCIHPHTDEAGYRHRLKHFRAIYEPVLRDFRVSPRSDRAFQEIVSLCRSSGIQVSLLRMPESTDFQSWYPPRVQEEVDAYLNQLRRDLDLPVLDTRRWVPDSGFSDGFHLYPEAAATYTERLGRDVIHARSTASNAAGRCR